MAMASGTQSGIRNNNSFGEFVTASNFNCFQSNNYLELG
jgi:hypothetical protein